MNLINKYCTFVNSLLPTRMQNDGGWVQFAAAGAAAIGSIVSALGQDSGADASGKVRKKTVSGQTDTDLDFLFDEEAEQAMKDFTEQISTWQEQDRDFFKNVFQPFQEKLLDTNSRLLPVIEKTSADSLEAIGRDIVENESLKTAFRKTVETGSLKMTDALDTFSKELENLPTEEQRVSEAFTRVEREFGQAGRNLARRMAEQGRAVTQSSRRQLEIEKAKTKAGVAGAAAEGARQERLSQLSAGLGTISDLQKSQTEQLTAAQVRQEAGLTAATGAQVGGVTAPTTDLTQTTAGLVSEAAGKQIGQTQQVDTIQHTQKGIKSAPVLQTGQGVAPGQIQTPAASTDPRTSEQRKRDWEQRMRVELAEQDRRRVTEPAGGDGTPGIGGTSGAPGPTGGGDGPMGGR